MSRSSCIYCGSPLTKSHEIKSGKCDSIYCPGNKK